MAQAFQIRDTMSEAELRSAEETMAADRRAQASALIQMALRAWADARVGVLTDQQWADDVTNRLAADFGAHVRDALAPWRADRGETRHPDDQPARPDTAAPPRRHPLQLH
ncbi:hypothetical protein GCM10010344_70630 [Streptomyces bluensis]|nr:hypothetical protein GCM10010344_70630 [Streptomyces bluensis]